MKLSWREKLLFSEALSFHLLTGMLLKIVPFRMIPRLFRKPKPAPSRQKETPPEGSAPRRKQADSGRQPADAEMIRDAVTRAGRVSPWRNRCLVSSLSARLMLGRRNIESELSLGVRKDESNRLRAHAWITSGKIDLVPEGENFTKMQTF